MTKESALRAFEAMRRFSYFFFVWSYDPSWSLVSPTVSTEYSSLFRRRGDAL